MKIWNSLKYLSKFSLIEGKFLEKVIHFLLLSYLFFTNFPINLMAENRRRSWCKRGWGIFSYWNMWKLSKRMSSCRRYKVMTWPQGKRHRKSHFPRPNSKWQNSWLKGGRGWWGWRRRNWRKRRPWICRGFSWTGTWTCIHHQLSMIFPFGIFHNLHFNVNVFLFFRLENEKKKQNQRVCCVLIEFPNIGVFQIFHCFSNFPKLH